METLWYQQILLLVCEKENLSLLNGMILFVQTFYLVLRREESKKQNESKFLH